MSPKVYHDRAIGFGGSGWQRVLGPLVVALGVATAGCGDRPEREGTSLPTKAPSIASATPLHGVSGIDTRNPIPADSHSQAASPAVASPSFTDVAAEWGLEFRYETGAIGKALMTESTGGGGGWVDFDRDSWPDLLLIQGGDPLSSPPHPAGDRLFRNMRGVRLSDVSTESLPHDHGYGQGLAVGDFDGDGFDDVLITNVGPDVLLKNLGDGTFADVTAEAGIGDPRWGTSAAWYDLDADGDLDAFVCNYLSYDVRNPRSCPRDDGTPAICHPEQIDPELSECWENLGDGRFQPVTEAWGLRAPNNKALGVVIADFNVDGMPDVFVANDVSANHLFVGDAPRRFSEQAVVLGCAYNALGQYQANMGVACQDYDGNGLMDLYVTHFTHDSNTLYSNLGSNGFRDTTRLEGLHRPTLELLGFGTVMTDFNADGAMDLFVANGHIDDWRFKGDAWKMRNQLFSFDGTRWVEHRAQTAGEFFDREHLGRAVSMADMDRDGDLDLLVVFQDAPAALLENTSARGAWLTVELLGTLGNRRGVGAEVTVTSGENRLVQQLTGGTSYLAAHEPILHFGLGASAGEVEIAVRWWNDAVPRTRIVNSAVNRRVEILEPQAN